MQTLIEENRVLLVAIATGLLVMTGLAFATSYGGLPADLDDPMDPIGPTDYNACLNPWMSMEDFFECRAQQICEGAIDPDCVDRYLGRLGAEPRPL